jgi:hypothetical protein
VDNTEIGGGSKRSVKIGESFRSAEYLQMPVLGHHPVEMEAVSIYRLVKVEGAYAIFDISFEFNDLGSSSREFKLLSEGSGKGQMTFDIANQLMIEERVSSNIAIKIVQGERIISSEMKSKSITTQEL